MGVLPRHASTSGRIPVKKVRWPALFFLFDILSVSQGPRFAEISRKISAVRWFNKTEDCIFPRSFIYGPMYNLSIFQSRSLLYTYSIVPIYLLFPEVHTPFAYIRDFPRAYLAHYKSIVLILTETNAIKCLSHPVFMARTVNAFTHVPDIPTRFFPICRLFFVTINHYLSLSIT